MSNYELYIPKADDDKERAVLPALIYASDSNEYVRVSILTLGWWKWGVAVKKVKEL